MENKQIRAGAGHEILQKNIKIYVLYKLILYLNGGLELKY